MVAKVKSVMVIISKMNVIRSTIIDMENFILFSQMMQLSYYALLLVLFGFIFIRIDLYFKFLGGAVFR